MVDLIPGVATHLLAGLILTGSGYSARILQDKVIARIRKQSISNLFNLTGEKIQIIHSSIYDSERDAYNYPACDSFAARSISCMLESVGVQEGSGYAISCSNDHILADGSINSEVWNSDLILICSPKRNRITHEVLSHAPKLRYRLQMDSSNKECVLFDTDREENLISYKEKSAIQRSEANNNHGYDYGLFLSMPNPLNHSRSVTIIAGIHGVGTLGTARYITTRKNISRLNKRKQGKIIEEVVKSVYRGGTENISELSLV